MMTAKRVEKVDHIKKKIGPSNIWTVRPSLNYYKGMSFNKSEDSHTQHPVYTVFDAMDTAWILESCREIVQNYKPTDYGNNSGKFFKNYETYWFHKSSCLPLVQTFIRNIEKNKVLFYETYGRQLSTDFVFLSRIRDASEPACIFHKDGYFWEGLFHMPVLGRSDIVYANNPSLVKSSEITDGDLKRLEFEPGTIWFFNSTHYFHTIDPTKGERLELCAPCGMHPEYVSRCLEGISLGKDGYMDGESLSWKNNKIHARKYILDSISKGQASNEEVADFAYDKED